MAKDRWGSLVLAAALSHVDDTVLLHKIVLPPLQVKPWPILQLHAHNPSLAPCCPVVNCQ